MFGKWTRIHLISPIGYQLLSITKFSVPRAFQAVSVALISGFTPIKTMGDMSSIGTLFAFLIVSIGVVILRITNPQIKRSFKCPAVFLVSTLSVLGCGFLIYKLLIDHYLPFVIWFVIGIIFYAIYGYKNSKLNQQ